MSGRAANQSTRQPSKLERQRAEIVQDVIRYQGFEDRAGCFTAGCDSHLTAKTPDGRRACPWHWPVMQLVLGC